MFIFLYRKFMKNRWLMLSLILGFTLAVSIITSVPMYSSGILKKIFIKDASTFHKTQQVYPGTLSFKEDKIALGPHSSMVNYYSDLDKRVNDAAKNFNLPILSSKRSLKTNNLVVGNIDSDNKPSNEKGPGFKLESVKNLEKNITILEGRIYSKDLIEDNIYEVIASSKTKHILDLKLDVIYTMRDPNVDEDSFLKVKIVGIYEADNKDNPYWLDKNYDYEGSLLIDENIYLNDYLKSNNTHLKEANWFFALDYNSQNLSNIKSSINSYDTIINKLNFSDDLTSYFPMKEILSKYIEKQNRLKGTLWTLETPVILMMLLYVFMLSSLILEKDSNEIVLLKSRGSNNTQIFLLYLMQFSIIAFIGAILGPILALLGCNLLGSSNGFLKFVNRIPLDIKITLRDYSYSFLTALVFLVATLIPIMKLSQNSIVETKRKKHRSTKPLWQRFYLDIILLSISLYSFYSYKNLEKFIANTAINSTGLPISPLLYLSMTLLVISIGLIYLRIYPYILTLILKIGKNKWSPTTYTSLITVSRNKSKDGFLIIFLILTLSIGIFNMKSASTINTMAENRVKYLNGADMVITPWWIQSDILNDYGKVIVPEATSDVINPNIPYKEPAFKPYTEIEGVDSITKVLKNDTGMVSFKEDISKVKSQVIAVIPDEFGKTAWFDHKLLPYHWYYYLNLIADQPKGILISENIKKDLNLELGSEVDIRFGETLHMQCYVLGIVDYWPSFDINKENTPGLIVMNYNYVRDLNVTLPYDIWIKKKDNVSDNELFQDIIKKDLGYHQINTIQQGIYDLKNDPILQGTNGTLNLCFLSSIIVTCMGFLIYWTMSIKNRTLQFGILRAMGLSMKEIIIILAKEQLLISGVSIFIGILIGSLISNLYIPMLNLASNPSEKLLPFRTISYVLDYIKLGLFMFIIVFIVMILLSRIIKKIKIDQALKLGED